MKAEETTTFESLWTVADVASYLAVSHSWVYRRVESRQLPHSRFGGCLRFEPEVIRQYAKQMAVRPEGHAKVLRLPPQGQRKGDGR